MGMRPRGGGSSSKGGRDSGGPILPGDRIPKREKARRAAVKGGTAAAFAATAAAYGIGVKELAEWIYEDEQDEAYEWPPGS
jgi:hypothetical protein